MLAGTSWTQAQGAGNLDDFSRNTEMLRNKTKPAVSQEQMTELQDRLARLERKNEELERRLRQIENRLKREDSPPAGSAR